MALHGMPHLDVTSPTIILLFVVISVLAWFKSWHQTNPLELRIYNTYVSKFQPSISTEHLLLTEMKEHMVKGGEGAQE